MLFRSSQRLVDGITSLADGKKTVITADPNPNNSIAYGKITAVKPNRHEAFHAAGIPDQPGELSREKITLIATELQKKWTAKYLLLTLGEQGMALFETGKKDPYLLPTRAPEVFDVSGAGDTAIALFTLGLTAELPPPRAAELANYASGIVVGKLGTASLTRKELVAALEN